MLVCTWKNVFKKTNYSAAVAIMMSPQNVDKELQIMQTGNQKWKLYENVDTSAQVNGANVMVSRV